MTEILWRNEDVKGRDSVKCIIPPKLYFLMGALDKKFADVEFSICVNSEYDKENKQLAVTYEDEKDVYVPKQKVTRTEVDYDSEDKEVKKYNTVIHKHPTGCLNFSGTDEDYINNNFSYSLLWVNNSFNKGIMNWDSKELGFRVRLKLDPEMNLPDVNLDTSKIEIKKPEPVQTTVITVPSTAVSKPNTVNKTPTVHTVNNKVVHNTTPKVVHVSNKTNVPVTVSKF